MRTPASIARHPIHPMLVPIPIGLWIFSFVCDALFLLGSGASVWYTLSFYTMIGGTIGGVIAAIPGFVDLMSLRQPARRLALAHMATNLTIIGLYAINIGLRLERADNAGLPVALAGASIALLLVSGWLGGQMVYVRGVGVSTEDTARAANDG